MPIIPENEKTIMDMVDAVIESWKIEVSYKDAEGKTRTERRIDERRAWWQMHHIGTNALGSFAKERENLGNLFKSAKYHMTSYRSDALQTQGLMLCEAYDHSIDAKSSECMRDQNNTNQTLLSMMAKAKTERQFTVKDELKASVWDGIRGKVAKDSANN